MVWKIHLREGKKKDLLASNPHHTYFSDQPNINYKLSNGKINVNPGGLGSWEPELDPGRVFGRLVACTGRGRGEKTEANTLSRMERRAPAWFLHAEPWEGGTGTVQRPAGPKVAPLFLPTWALHIPGNTWELHIPTSSGGYWCKLPSISESVPWSVW